MMVWRRGKSLFGELVFLIILLSSLVIIAVESIAMLFISHSMHADLRRTAVQTAEEIAAILEEPLFILDNAQALRIGEALLTSGRISGIRISSTATGIIIDQPAAFKNSSIQPIGGTIERFGLPLGDYYIEFSDSEIVQTRERLLVISIGVILAVIASNTLGIRYIILKHINNAFLPVFTGIKDIAAGIYDKSIQASSYEEVDRLIQVVNEMAAQINLKNQALQEANRTLEHKVTARTIELEASLSGLQQAQDRLVQSEKLSALGQLSAGIAHELNTPLGAILSSNRLVLDFFDRQLPALLDFHPQLDAEGKHFVATLLGLATNSQHAYDMAISARKLRSLVQLELEAATCPQAKRLAELLVDLGLNKQLNLLLPWLSRPDAVLILEKTSALLVGRRMVEIIEIAGDKAANVVSALRSYLTPDNGNEHSVINIEAEIDKILTLMQNMLKHGVRIIRNYGGISLPGSREKIGQVLLNIIRNAAQAINYKGSIQIKTRIEADFAVITVRDDGPGIPATVLPRIFEPFFTTKHQDAGMGLGLDICKHIIDNHGGSIEVKSQPGDTEFSIRLPGATARSLSNE